MSINDLLLWWFFGSLTAFRLSLLFSKESGPARIFAKLRKLPPAHSSAREGLSCQWCMSVYSSAVVCLGFWAGDLRLHWAIWITLWLSISTGAICINQTFTKGK